VYLTFGGLGAVEILRFRSSVRKKNLQSVDWIKKYIFILAIIT